MSYIFGENQAGKSQQQSASDTLVINSIAAEDIGGGRVVYVNETGALKFDANNEGLADKIAGITKGAVVNGQLADIVSAGIIYQGGWGLIPGENYFAGADGLIYSVPPNVKVFAPVGVAITAEKLLLKNINNVITV